MDSVNLGTEFLRYEKDAVYAQRNIDGKLYQFEFIGGQLVSIRNGQRFPVGDAKFDELYEAYGQSVDVAVKAAWAEAQNQKEYPEHITKVLKAGLESKTEG